MRQPIVSHARPRNAAVILAFALTSIVTLLRAADDPIKPIFSDNAPACSGDSLTNVVLPNVTIDSVATNADGSCRITAIVTHPPANDRVKVFIALPMKNWNGRFMGTGGGGFLGGSPAVLSGPVRLGFAAGATDTGHEGGSGSFGLDANGRLNWQVIVDNAYLGIHEMTVVGKALARAYYGKEPRYSYFVGASTGGRQGLMEAQRYPEDYNGIISGCPAINWHKFVMASLWPQVVINTTGDHISVAKLHAVTAAAVAACDGADGVTDGVIDDPTQCTYDPKALVGTDIDGSTFTDADADLIRKIWQGPRAQDGSFIWYGLSRGADLTALAGPHPFTIPVEWVRYFLTEDPKWELSTLTPPEFEALFKQAEEEYGLVYGTDNPDLSGYRDHGGKIIILHGQADQLIPTQGTIEYYQRVLKQMGGRDAVMQFARLFLIPGAPHGNGGVAGLNEAIVNWVEDGAAPDKLINHWPKNRTRPLFPYPEIAKYTGTGSTDEAENFSAAMPADSEHMPAK